MGSTLLLASLVIANLGWLVVEFRRGWFERLEADDDSATRAPAAWPDVTAIVPARDEAALVGQTLTTLLAQDYPGRLTIILIDDESTDGTGTIARRIAANDARLTVLDAGPRPPGWTGKLWAVSRGIEQATTPALWLTDADIAHTPTTLRALVARRLADRLVLVSRMARLNTSSAAERAIAPAFVYFFNMLYPFVQVNNPGSRIAAAAGGCMLIHAPTLAHAGGIEAIRSALIDDVAMGRLLKRYGPIRLSLSRDTRSLRAQRWDGLFAMIARSAYAQLGFRPLALAGAIVGMGAMFVVLPLTAAVFATEIVFASDHALIAKLALFGLITTAVCARHYVAILRLYRLSPLRVLTLPAIALFFLAATIWSAVQHHRGRGGLWKGRAQAMPQPRR